MDWCNLRNKNIFSLRWVLVATILLSFLIPLIYSFIHRIRPVVDTRAYDQIAINLADGFGYRENRNNSYESDTAIVRAGPAYEFFLAGIYKIFGYHHEAVWVIQALLHALTAWLLFLIARKIFENEKAGLLAAMLFGLHPDLIEISAMLMTETLYLFFITLVIFVFVRIYNSKNRSVNQSALLGAIAGLAVLTRPTVILFLLPILFFYVFKKEIRNGSVFLFAFIAILTPWSIRNYLVYHQFILTTLTGSFNLWIGNTLVARGGQIAGGFNPFDEYVRLQGFNGIKERATQEFLFFALNYPLVFIKLFFLRIIRFFSLIRPMGFWFYQSGIKQLVFVLSSLGWGAVFFISGYSGLFALSRERKVLFNYFIVFALLAPLPLLLTVVQSRYRFQIYPFLAIFGGYFLSRLLDDRKTVKKYLQIVAIVLLVVSLFDAAYFLPLIKERLSLFL
ncbi:MAG: glycosyltransferase family 39 protein [Patescibacteria group bacterium]